MMKKGSKHSSQYITELILQLHVVPYIGRREGHRCLGWGVKAGSLVILHCFFSVEEEKLVLTFNSFQGSARRLVKAALQEAAKKREMRYSDLKKIDRGVRRHFHDDITVIVVFLDSNLVSKASSVKCSNLSVRGGGINLPPNILAPCAAPTEAGNT